MSSPNSPTATGVTLPQEGPVSITIPVAWGEMDAFGHVNNAVYFRYLESARIEFLRRARWFAHSPSSHETGTTGGADFESVGVILHSVQARFRAPVTFPDTLRVSSKLLSIETDRFTLGHEIWSEKLGLVAATGSGIIVAYRYPTRTGERGEKAPIPEQMRRAILALSGPM